MSSLGPAEDRAAGGLRGSFLKERLIDAANQGILGVNGLGRLVYLNPMGAALTGYGPDEALGQSWHGLVAPVWPDGRPCDEETSPLGQTLRHGVRHRVPAQIFRRKDGSALRVSYQTAPLTASAGIEGAVVTFIDIDAQQLDAAALRRQLAINELLTTVAIAANEAHSLEEGARIAIDRVCAFLGWPVGHLYVPSAEGDTLVSTDVWHLADPVRFQQFKAISDGFRFPAGLGLPGAVLESGQARWITDVYQDANFPRARLARDLGVRAGLGVPILVGHEVVGVLEFFAEIPVQPDEPTLAVLQNLGVQLGRVAERRRAIEVISRHEARTHLEQLKSAFIDAVSHELRTPLTSILGFSELLSDRESGALTPAQSAYVSGIEAGATRLRHLVNQLLDVAGMVDGSFELSRMTVDVAELVEGAIAPFRPLAAEAGLTLQVELPPALPSVALDPGRINQALSALVDNALKFTPTGTVTVRTGCVGGALRFEVADTGPGIAPEHHARIFEKFYQVDGTLARAHGGTGLGLAIAGAFVQAHGGAIGVESTPGSGSTFWFTVPGCGGPPGA